MKICVFLYSLNSGGAEKIMVGFANYAIRYGHEVTILLGTKKGEYFDIIDHRINVISLGKDSIFELFSPLYSHLKKERYDVVYTSLTNQNIVSIIIGKVLNIKVIIREANTSSENRNIKRFNLWNRLRNFICKWAYKDAYHCIAISNAVKMDLLKFTKLKEEKISVIYNPIKIIDTVPVGEIPGFNVCFVSRLTLQKNIDTIVKVIEIVLNRDQNIIFNFFGKGEEIAKIENLKRIYPENIQIHGFVLSYYSFVKAMDIFIHIPLWEGLGNSVLEIYQSGIPMILSEINSGFSELIVSDEENNVHYVAPTGMEFQIADLIADYFYGRKVVSKNRKKLNLEESVIYEKYLNLIGIK